MNEVVKQQSTHWYRSKGKHSYTADPRQADPGEVARVGLHNCREIGCKEPHACDILDYSYWLIRNQYRGETGKS